MKYKQLKAEDFDRMPEGAVVSMGNKHWIYEGKEHPGDPESCIRISRRGQVYHVDRSSVEPVMIYQEVALHNAPLDCGAGKHRLKGLSEEERGLLNEAYLELVREATKIERDELGWTGWLMGRLKREPLPKWDAEEMERNFTLAFIDDPSAAIRAINRCVYRKDDIMKYAEMAVDLEIKLDRQLFDHSGTVMMGVPRYIPDGFVDMGKDQRDADRSERREKFGIRKADHKEDMVRAKLIAKKAAESGSDPKMEIAKLSRIGMVYSDRGVKGLIEERGIENTVHGRSLIGTGNGICRHTDILFQMLAQTAGLESYIAKRPDHTFNYVVEDCGLFLVDATPSMDGKELPGVAKVLGMSTDVENERTKKNYWEEIRRTAGTSPLGRAFLPRDMSMSPNYFKINGVEEESPPLSAEKLKELPKGIRVTINGSLPYILDDIVDFGSGEKAIFSDGYGGHRSFQLEDIEKRKIRIARRKE